MDRGEKEGVLRALEKAGYSARADEFKVVLDRFKDYPEAIAALRKGVERFRRVVDDCDNTPAGYHEWVKKDEMLYKFDLENTAPFGGTGLKGAFSMAAELRGIKERLDRLEGRNTPRKPQRPDYPPYHLG